MQIMLTTPDRPMPPGRVCVMPRDHWTAEIVEDGKARITSIPLLWRGPAPGDVVRIVADGDSYVFSGEWRENNLSIDCVSQATKVVELRYFDHAGSSALFEADEAHVRKTIAAIAAAEGWNGPVGGGYMPVFRLAVPVAEAADEVVAALQGLVGLRGITVMEPEGDRTFTIGRNTAATTRKWPPRRAKSKNSGGGVR